MLNTTCYSTLTRGLVMKASSIEALKMIKDEPIMIERKLFHFPANIVALFA